MKANYRTLLVLGIITIALNLLPIMASAQITGPGGPGGDPDAPIDGGLSVLLVAGVGYGLKKARDAKKDKNITID